MPEAFSRYLKVKTKKKPAESSRLVFFNLKVVMAKGSALINIIFKIKYSDIFESQIYYQ